MSCPARRFAYASHVPTLNDYLQGLFAVASEWVDTPRAYINAGKPQGDCDSLVVWCERIDSVTERRGSCSGINRVTFHVSRFMCAPTMDNDGEALDTDTLTAIALRHADDGWAIWKGITAGWSAGTLFGGLGVACSSIDLSQGMTAIENLGGMTGWDAVIRLQPA